jgi:hypothetical protein
MDECGAEKTRTSKREGQELENRGTTGSMRGV